MTCVGKDISSHTVNKSRLGSQESPTGMHLTRPCVKEEHVSRKNMVAHLFFSKRLCVVRLNKNKLKDRAMLVTTRARKGSVCSVTHLYVEGFRIL